MSKHSDEDALRQCLGRIALRLHGKESGIEAVRRSRSSYSTFYDTEIVEVRLLTGEEFKVFLKDFGSYRNRKDEMELRRERELHVYQNLLPEAHLDTARYYGSAWDESEGRFWLLLEFVNGSLLRYCTFEHWLRAAAWLGRLQGYYARFSDHFGDCSLLLQHNADFFWSRANLAFRAASKISTTLADRVENMLRHYDEVVRVMADQPITFVHGAYTPTQILLDVDGDPPRVCPIDWERAALGSPLYDLAFFSDGFERPRLNQLWDAYREEAGKQNISVPGKEETQRIADCFRLHKIMSRLSKSVERHYSEKGVVRLIDLGEKLNAQLA
jgi:thiamine kinase-like enzyme